MHTLTAIFGVIAEIILILAVLSIIVGVVWIISPLKDKMYMGSLDIYQYYTPMGGRLTGLIILGSGVAGLILGLLLDEVHIRIAKRFGARI